MKMPLRIYLIISYKILKKKLFKLKEFWRASRVKEFWKLYKDWCFEFDKDVHKTVEDKLKEADK